MVSKRIGKDNVSVGVYSSHEYTGTKKESANVSVLAGNINDGRDSSYWNSLSFTLYTSQCF